jgi:hypothetical protein
MCLNQTPNRSTSPIRLGLIQSGPNFPIQPSPAGHRVASLRLGWSRVEPGPAAPHWSGPPKHARLGHPRRTGLGRRNTPAWATRQVGRHCTWAGLCTSLLLDIAMDKYHRYYIISIHTTKITPS